MLTGNTHQSWGSRSTGRARRWALVNQDYLPLLKRKNKWWKVNLFFDLRLLMIYFYTKKSERTNSNINETIIKVLYPFLQICKMIQDPKPNHPQILFIKPDWKTFVNYSIPHSKYYLTKSTHTHVICSINLQSNRCLTFLLFPIYSGSYDFFGLNSYTTVRSEYVKWDVSGQYYNDMDVYGDKDPSWPGYVFDYVYPIRFF